MIQVHRHDRDFQDLQFRRQDKKPFEIIAPLLWRGCGLASFQKKIDSLIFFSSSAMFCSAFRWEDTPDMS